MRRGQKIASPTAVASKNKAAGATDKRRRGVKSVGGMPASLASSIARSASETPVASTAGSPRRRSASTDVSDILCLITSLQQRREPPL